MRRMVWAVGLLVSLTFALLGSHEVLAGSEDPGDDGFDYDCADFQTPQAAHDYFELDGGTADRNVDNLDPDGDGFACDAGPFRDPDAASQDAEGISSDAQAELPADTDDEVVSDATWDVVAMPNTGSGAESLAPLANANVLFAVLAMMLLSMAGFGFGIWTWHRQT